MIHQFLLPARTRRSVVATCAALVLITAGACGDDDDFSSAGDDPVATPAPTVETTTTTSSTAIDDEPDEQGEPVNVYFLRGEELAAAGRNAPAGDLLTSALDALLAGPDQLESDLTMLSEIPTDTELLGATVDDGLATIDLSGAFESGGGSLSMQARVAQVVFTATHDPAVAERVTILIDGEEVDGIGGEGVGSTELTRDDFTDLTPRILVESPTPGEQVEGTLEVVGSANVFEANLNYEVLDADGTLLGDGFATTEATDINTWGAFSFTVDLSGAAAGTGTLVVFEPNAEDGADDYTIELPVEIGT